MYLSYNSICYLVLFTRYLTINLTSTLHSFITYNAFINRTLFNKTEGAFYNCYSCLVCNFVKKPITSWQQVRCYGIWETTQHNKHNGLSPALRASDAQSAPINHTDSSNNVKSFTFVPVVAI